jgi:hypothetical protein
LPPTSAPTIFAMRDIDDDLHQPESALGSPVGQPSHVVGFHRIGRDSHDVGVTATAAIECPDIEAGWSSHDANKRHRGAAFWAISTLKGGGRKAWGRNGLWHQAFNVCASSHFRFLKRLRRDKAICRC